MKIPGIFNTHISLLTFAILLIINSCSNDFLHEEKIIYSQLIDTIKMNDMETEKTVVIHLPEDINAKWHIAQFPSWLKLSQIEGTSSDGKITIDLQVPNRYIIQKLGVVDVPLIFEVEGLGYIQYPFRLINYGYPEPFVSKSNLNISYRTKDDFFIQNSSQSILIWEIIQKPAWLTVSKAKGKLESVNTDNISVTVSRDNLPKGNYEGKIVIKVNSPEQTITVNVTMEVLDLTFSGQVTAIQGDVIDADNNQNTGLLVFTTQNPNRLYYKKSDQLLSYTSLDRIPTSVDISESGDQIAVTFTNTDLTLFDGENIQVVKTLKTGTIASDVALGGNGWAYVCPLNYSTNFLLSVNLASGAITQHKENLNGLTLLRKVPGKNLIYGSKVGWGPDYLFVFDSSTGAINEKFDQYVMELWKFWLSDNGERIYTGLKQIYYSPAYLQLGYTDSKPKLAGQYTLSGTITSIGHSAMKGEFFVAHQPLTVNGASIAIIDDNSYGVKKSVKVRNAMFIENDYLLDLSPTVPYMYADKTGKELYVIKYGESSYPKKYWFFEKITNE